MIGLRVLERLKPKRKNRQESEKLDWELPSAEIPYESPPSLQELLQHLDPISPCSIVLGACEDGLPFLLDLNNPAPGALLIAGDPASGKTRLLRSILTSAVLLNRADDVSFFISAAQPVEYISLVEAPHLRNLVMPDEPALDHLISSLASTAEKRMHSGQALPACILVIDDLMALYRWVDENVLASFQWLLQYGPAARIWTLAAISSPDAGRMDEGLLAGFPTRLVGHIQSAQYGSYLSGSLRLDTTAIQSGTQFFVPFGEEWIPFWVVDPE